MAEEIVMPRLGWTMTEGTLVEWLKKDGETVEVGESIFTVESDKAVLEVETFSSGVLHIPPTTPQPGDTVEIGTVLGYLLQPGENKPVVPTARTKAPREEPPCVLATKPDPHVTVEPSASPRTKSRDTLRKISPRARRLAEELGVDWRLIDGTGRTGRISENDVRKAAETTTGDQVST